MSEGTNTTLVVFATILGLFTQVFLWRIAFTGWQNSRRHRQDFGRPLHDVGAGVPMSLSVRICRLHA